jgi:hypothetical protein
LPTLKLRSTHLYDRTGPDYSQSEAREILGLSPNSDALWRWRKTGAGPAFRRLGHRHSRVTFPRAQFWARYDQFVFESETDVEEAAGKGA